jgi:hypothetical protein
MPLSQTTETALLNWILGAAFPSAPTQTWLSLHNSQTVDNTTQINGWAGGNRIQIGNSDFSVASNATGGGMQRINGHALAFGVNATAQTVMAFGLWDAPVGGNLLISGDVAPDVVVNAGDPPIFMTADLILKAV